MKLVAALLTLTLLLAPLALADVVDVDPGEQTTITTTCISDGLMAANSATAKITDKEGNEVIPDTNMTLKTSGVYTLPVTFKNPGSYIVTQTCYYDDTYAQASDTYNVKNVIGPEMLLILFGYLLAWLFVYRPGYHVLGAGAFVAVSTVFFLQYSAYINTVIVGLPLAMSALFLLHELNETLFHGKEWFNGW